MTYVHTLTGPKLLSAFVILSEQVECEPSESTTIVVLVSSREGENSLLSKTAQRDRIGRRADSEARNAWRHGSSDLCSRLETKREELEEKGVV